MSEPLFSSVVIDISGPDGNAFAIIAIVMNCLKQCGYSKEEMDKIKKDMMSKDYNYLCSVASKYVSLVGNDDDGDDEFDY